MCPQFALQLTQTLLTFVVAAIAAWIAWGQWQTNRHKLAFEMYDRRLKVYEEAKAFLGAVGREGTPNLSDLIDFRRKTAEADFLFAADIPKYLDDLFRHGSQLRTWSDQYRDHTQPIPANYDHEAVANGMHRELSWLMEQFDPLKEKFQKYLHVVN